MDNSDQISHRLNYTVFHKLYILSENKPKDSCFQCVPKLDHFHFYDNWQYLDKFAYFVGKNHLFNLSPFTKYACQHTIVEQENRPTNNTSYIIEFLVIRCSNKYT